MLRLFFILFLMCSIVSCTVSSPEDVMSIVPYTGTVKVHSNKVAHLNWQVGKQQAESDPAYISPDASLLGAVIVSSIDYSQRKRNPGRYNYSFGKAQQAVFMTSLRDALVDKNVFKQVRLEAQSSATNKNDVFITVYFKSTRAHAASGGFGVTLDVMLRVKMQNKSDFERTYFVQSDPESTKDKSFIGQQMDASEKLLAQLINGITTALK